MELNFSHASFSSRHHSGGDLHIFALVDEPVFSLWAISSIKVCVVMFLLIRSYPRLQEAPLLCHTHRTEESYRPKSCCRIGPFQVNHVEGKFLCPFFGSFGLLHISMHPMRVLDLCVKAVRCEVCVSYKTIKTRTPVNLRRKQSTNSPPHSPTCFVPLS